MDRDDSVIYVFHVIIYWLYDIACLTIDYSKFS